MKKIKTDKKTTQPQIAAGPKFEIGDLVYWSGHYQKFTILGFEIDGYGNYNYLVGDSDEHRRCEVSLTIPNFGLLKKELETFKVPEYELYMASEELSHKFVESIFAAYESKFVKLEEELRQTEAKLIDGIFKAKLASGLFCLALSFIIIFKIN